MSHTASHHRVAIPLSTTTTESPGRREWVPAAPRQTSPDAPSSPKRVWAVPG
jgi:hypothetical protein